MAERKTPEPDIETLEAEAEGETLLGRVRRSLGHDAAPKTAKPKKEPLPRGHPNHDEVTELVGLVNLPIALVSPRDALTDWEVKRLTDALDSYAQTSESARRWMYAVVKRSAVLALLNVLGALALPRMIRHGMLPPTLAPYLTGMCDPAQLADAIGMEPQADGTWGFNPNGTTPFGADSRPADIRAL